MDKYHRRVATQIRAVAKARGLRLTHLADRAGISRSQLWNVLGGRKSPTVAWLVKVASVLDVDLMVLLQCPESKRANV